MKIIYIQTGGTIDKDYPSGESDHGYAFEITDPASKDILKESFIVDDYEIKTILKKDSLDITDDDRQAIYDMLEMLPEDRVVITHGTDTIGQTAQKLSTIQDKTIVITGAMLPEKFKTSDARFNIGMATAAVQTLNPGVYVALYGKVVPHEQFPALLEAFESSQKTPENIDYER